MCTQLWYVQSVWLGIICALFLSVVLVWKREDLAPASEFLGNEWNKCEHEESGEERTILANIFLSIFSIFINTLLISRLPSSLWGKYNLKKDA